MSQLLYHAEIQALFESKRKHYLIPPLGRAQHNQAMLTGKELARRLKSAIKDAGLTQAMIAEACGVTPQAVHEWLKTGRIAKWHLSTVANLVHKDLDYFLSDAKSTLTKMSVSNIDAEEVRIFLAADHAWRELWLEIVKGNDARLRRIVELYSRLEEPGRQMILSAARGAVLLKGDNDRGDLGDTGKANRKTD